MPPQHRPGALKQQNKKHKGPTAKRLQNRALGAGKVEKSGLKGKDTSHALE